MPDMENKLLRLPELTQSSSIAALGTVAAKELLINREVALFVDCAGCVQLIPIAELLLDALPEQMAIQEMAKQKISDVEIESYLRGRDARMRSRNGGIL